MNFSVHALLVSKDHPSTFWVGEYAQGQNKGLIGLPGGKSGYPEQIMNAIRRELEEETRLPPRAFDIPARVRPLDTRHKKTKAYYFFVWLEPGYVPLDNEEIVGWRRVTPREALANPNMLDFAKDYLVDWLQRDDCPLTRSVAPTSPSSSPAGQ
jgi:8-oxo-dGTP pyrophosphatase MutT (NUDIX family)